MPTYEPGYSTIEASRLAHRVDTLMAKIEDTAYTMIRLVPDHNLRVDNQLEELREIADQIKGVIERRRRR